MARKKKYRRAHADRYNALQQALSTLGAQSAPLHFGDAALSFLFVSSPRFNMRLPFVRALRLADLPEFIRGRIFERSSVKNSAMFRRKLRRRHDTFIVFITLFVIGG